LFGRTLIELAGIVLGAIAIAHYSKPGMLGFIAVTLVTWGELKARGGTRDKMEILWIGDVMYVSFPEHDRPILFSDGESVKRFLFAGQDESKWAPSARARKRVRAAALNRGWRV
jgi:hypothetical protein